MWRAWGITLLVLSQDLGPVARSEDHEFLIRPPQGWVLKPAPRPTVVKWVIAEGGKAVAEVMVTHLVSGNPTPLKNLELQEKERLASRYKGAKVAEEKVVTLGGRAAYRLVYSHEGMLYIHMAIHRTNLEYYMLDALLQEATAAKYRAVAEASMATFEIVPTTLTGEEQAARAQGLAVLKGAKIDPAMLGERWHAIHLGQTKTGRQRIKLGESEGMYTFELDVESDYGQGKTDVTHVRGSFSPDGRVQKLDTEQTKTNDQKERWQFRASAVLQNGQVKVSRDLNGTKEEKSFPVEEGVLFGDVADLLRGFLAAAGKGSYLVKTLSPYVDEPNAELLEVGEKERLDIDGKSRDVILVQSRVDRKFLTYTYAAGDRSLIRLGGAKDAFSIRACTKEEALK